MSRYNEGTFDYVTYKEFIDMDNIRNSPPKGDTKTQQAINENKYIYSIATHPIFDTNDGYLFIGEAYHLVPAKVNNAEITYNIQLDNALVSKFSDEGKYQWDYAFELTTIPLDEFEPRLTYHLTNEKNIHFSYSNLKNYVTEVITKDGKQDSRWGVVFPKIDISKLEIKYARAEHWFDNYMLAYLGVAKNLTTRVGTKLIVKKAVIQNQSVISECDLRFLLSQNKKLVDSIDDAEKDSVATLMAELTIANKWSEDKLLTYSRQLLKEEPYVSLQGKREAKIAELMTVVDLLNSGNISDCEAIEKVRPMLAESSILINEQYLFLKERVRNDLAKASVADPDCSEDDIKHMMDESLQKIETLEKTNQKEFERKLQLLKNKKGWSESQIANYSTNLVSDEFFIKTSEIKMKYLSHTMSIIESARKKETTDCKAADQLRQVMEENAKLISKEWAYVFTKINKDLE